MSVTITQIVSVVSCLVGVLTFYLKVRSDMRNERAAEQKRRETEIAMLQKTLDEFSDTIEQKLAAEEKEIANLKAEHEKDMQAFELKMEQKVSAAYNKADEKRSESVKKLYARIEEVETNYGTKTIERISKLEGTMGAKLDSMEETLNRLQNYIMDK